MSKLSPNSFKYNENMIFDGKAFAREIEARLAQEVAKMARKPKIVSVLVGDDPASQLYTKLKKSAAERVGVEFEVVKIDDTKSYLQNLLSQIRQLSARQDVTGILVQLPIPGLHGQELQETLRQIPRSKDVDGLRWEESQVMPATVRAILAICESMAKNQYPVINNHARSNNDKTVRDFWQKRFVVLGARGAIGKPLVFFLKQRGVEVVEIEWDTPDPTRIILEGEVVISCVGKAGLVTGGMVREGVIAIDVGMSQIEEKAGTLHAESKLKVVGDMTQEVYQKASIAVPVPGGVGPVTIASLMANTVETSGKL